MNLAGGCAGGFYESFYAALKRSNNTRLERVARALYAYDNPGTPWDGADEDARSPYYDLAAIALEAAA